MNLEGITPEVVKQMTDAVLAIAPELQGVIDDLRSRAASEEEAMLLLLQWCEDNPAMVEQMTAKFLNTNLAVPDQQPKRIESPLPQMLVAERAQFDGDVPEFRTGPLTGNAMPAIPVQTNSRSPVQIGMMLEAVSQEVKQESLRLTSEWQKLVEGSTGTDLMVSDQPPDPASYPAGKAAEMVVVTEKPSTLMLTPEQRQKYAWGMISTSQGRRSALSQLSEMIEALLQEAGLECKTREFDPNRRVGVVAHSAWQYLLTGRADLQPQFSFVEVAAKTIADDLIAKGAKGWLEVVPIDTVDLRKVGWACRIVEDK